MNNEELSWSEIVNLIIYDGVKPTDQFIVFMMMLSVCASATGRMPNRIAVGLSDEFVAYYLDENGYAGIEVYPVSDSESWPDGVLFWAKGEFDHAEDIYYPDILDPNRYTVFDDFFRASNGEVLNEDQ